MSANATTAATQAEEASEAHNFAFRIAFAAATGLTLGEILGWDFPFLPAMLAVQLLTGLGPISVKQGIGLVGTMAAACAFTAILGQILIDSTLILVLTVSLLVFLEFLLIARGQAVGIATIFLMNTAIVPLLGTESMSLANELIFSLIAGTLLAVLLAFAAHALFPTRLRAEPLSTSAQIGSPTSIALANTAVLMSVVVYFIVTTSPVSMVVVLTVIGILRQPVNLAGGAAFGLILGNLVGGFAATVAYLLVTLFPSPAFLLLVVLLAGLLLGERIARGGALAPIYTVSLITFLIVLGLGLSPLPQDSGAIFTARVFDVLVAGVYAIGMASLLRSAFRAI
jgi:Protein of unknown function (DUF2955)